MYFATCHFVTLLTYLVSWPWQPVTELRSTATSLSGQISYLLSFCSRICPYWLNPPEAGLSNEGKAYPSAFIPQIVQANANDELLCAWLCPYRRRAHIAHGSFYGSLLQYVRNRKFCAVFSFQIPQEQLQLTETVPMILSHKAARVGTASCRGLVSSATHIPTEAVVAPFANVSLRFISMLMAFWAEIAVPR